MDMPELLARAGIQPDAVADLMTWARARTSVLLAALDPKSSLGQSLAPGLAQLVMRQGPESESDILDVPPPPPLAAPSSVLAERGDQATARGPRATARVISRPFLGAAVEAALQGGETSANLSPETVEPPPPQPEPAPVLDDEASIGGFTRFGFSMRRAPVEAPTDTRVPLAHGFALHSEREASQFTDVPAPPSFEASESGVRASLKHITGGDSERSTSLVVGIPDDEGADIPVLRGRGRSGASRPASGPSQESTLELNLHIEDPELSSALLRMVPANGETSTMLAVAASSALMRDFVPRGEPSLQITIDEGSALVPVAPRSEPEDAAAVTPVVDADRGPQPARRASRPPPLPAQRVATAQPQPAPPSQSPDASGKQKRSRKKIVDLSTPVVRPVARPSAPEPTAQRVNRETARPELAPIPNYLRDDDE